MKKQITLFVFLFCLSAFNARSQSIRDDPNYLRQLNYFWGITNSFAKVRSEYDSRSSKAAVVKSEQAEVIATLLTRSENSFEKLRAAYPDDKEFKEIEKCRQVLTNALTMLQDGKAQGPPMWQMGYVLVQMGLEDRLVE